MLASIHNEFLTLTVDTHGAEIHSVKNAKGEEMLWQGDPAVWPRRAPILFPWTGKQPTGAFTWQGKSYPAPQHGFARDLEHTLLKAEGDTLVMELKSGPETAERFPFAFTLTSRFRLEGQTVCQTLEVQNNSDGPMPFGIGFHPGFSVPFDTQHDTEDYEFRFDRAESPVCLSNRPNGLFSGSCSYALGRNRRAIPLTDHLFDNDSFCMTGLSSSTLGIYEKDTGRHITCRIAGYPYTLIWSAATPKCHFVCIEPWRSLPGEEGGSADWNERAAAAVLAPGQSDETALRIEFAR